MYVCMYVLQWLMIVKSTVVVVVAVPVDAFVGGCFCRRWLLVLSVVLRCGGWHRLFSLFYFLLLPRHISTKSENWELRTEVMRDEKPQAQSVVLPVPLCRSDIYLVRWKGAVTVPIVHLVQCRLSMQCGFVFWLFGACSRCLPYRRFDSKTSKEGFSSHDCSLYFITVPYLYHFITSSLHHFITSSLHHFITSSLHHFITSSLQTIFIVWALTSCVESFPNNHV